MNRTAFPSSNLTMFAHPREARAAMRSGKFQETTRGVCLGYVQCALVILDQHHAYDFLLYCQRNQRACPLLEVTDRGIHEARYSAPGSDLRTDLPLYSIYRNGKHEANIPDISEYWTDRMVAFLIGSGISFDQALQRAGVATDRNRWVLNTNQPTQPAGVFGGQLVVTMRWLPPEQAIKAIQVTTRFPFNHGAPIHVGDPKTLGCDLENPLFGGEVPPKPDDLVALYWACSVTPQAAALNSGLDLMISSAPSYGFVTDVTADSVCTP